MFTLWPAWASFREAELGTIEVGKRADFSAFSVDLMTAPVAEIPGGHAVLTIVDGMATFARISETDGVVFRLAGSPLRIAP